MRFNARGLAMLVGLALSSSAVCGPALADDPSYTIEDVKACSRDALRLCRDKLGHLDEIESCMRAHYAQLSPKCQSRFR